VPQKIDRKEAEKSISNEDKTRVSVNEKSQEIAKEVN
jgi:hypothetical protein